MRLKGTDDVLTPADLGFMLLCVEKRKNEHDIGYVAGWFCGAVFPAAPVAALICIVCRKRRQAFQALAVPPGTLADIGACGLMLPRGNAEQKNRSGCRRT